MILRINSDYFLNQLIFAIVKRCVFFEVGTEYLTRAPCFKALTAKAALLFLYASDESVLEILTHRLGFLKMQSF
jgi:hypothetical protein